MSVLITGGLGYIGGNIAKSLLENGEDVVLLDNLSNTSIGKASLIKSLVNKNFKVYPRDLLNERELIQVFKENQIESVIYLAEDRSEDPLKYYKNNINMLINTVNTMRTFNCKRLIFASMDIYKNEGEQTEAGEKVNILDEGTTIKQKVKLVSEGILMDLLNSERNEGWSINILRLFTISGADASGHLGDVNLQNNDIFTRLMKKELNKEDLVLSNKYISYDGTLVRDYTHIQDVVKGFIKSLNYIRLNSNIVESFNISSNKPTSEKQIIKLYNIITASELKYKETNITDERISNRIGNKAKSIKLLKYNNEYTVDSIIKSNIEFCTNYNQILKDYRASEKEIYKSAEKDIKVKEEVDKNE